MKKECAVVQDLLVLYEDDVLKEESRQIVEEHIQGCEECMKVYENAGKELPVMEAVSESSREEQEAAANQIMKRLMKMSSRRIVGILLFMIPVVVIVITVARNICNSVTETYYGLSSIYLLPTEDISVAELYTLKNGEIYCRLKSDKKVNEWMMTDWDLANEKMFESTDDVKKELRFRETLPWKRQEWDTFDSTFIFTLERHGTLEESGDSIIQKCKEINIYGKTKKDKLTIWKKGQNVEEAPKEIEKEAVQRYIEEGQIAKAIRECEMMGWDDYEKIFGEFHHTEIQSDERGAVFEDEGNSISGLHVGK